MTEITRREFLAKSAVGAVSIAGAALAPSSALGANDRISIAMIGAGSRAGQHMNDIIKLSKSMNVEITAVCDTWRIARENAAKRVKEEFGKECRAFSNYEDVIALGDVNAVVITTPDFSHSKILADAMLAGKDAYCEKPMATELADAILAIDTAKKTGRVVQIGTQRRSEGKWRGMVKMVQSGILGTVSRVEVAWNDSGPRWNRGFSDVKEEDVDWKRFLMGKSDRPFDPSRYRRWHFYRDYTNGVIGLLGSHYIDVAAWAMNDPLPISAVAHGGIYVWKDGREHEDTVYAIYDFPKGFACRYLTGLGNSAESGLRIYGTDGMFSEATWTFTGTGGGSKKLKEPIAFTPEKSDNHMGNWIECMRSRKATNAPIEIGYEHSVACIMGYQALLTGKKMKYLPDLRRIVEAGVWAVRG